MGAEEDIVHVHGQEGCIGEDGSRISRIMIDYDHDQNINDGSAEVEKFIISFTITIIHPLTCPWGRMWDGEETSGGPRSLEPRDRRKT